MFLFLCGVTRYQRSIRTSIIFFSCKEMGLIGEEFLRTGAASVLTAEQTHLLRPCGRGDEGEGNVERSQDTLDDTGGAAKAEGRGHALAWHGVNLLYDCVGAIGVGAQEISKAHRVNLIDLASASFHLSCRHVDDDEMVCLGIEDRKGASSARINSDYLTT